MTRPTVAVWKFASCDGCQLTILDCEDELLQIAAALDLRMFLEAGPEELLDHYDISFVEGSVTTAHDAERIRDIRARSGMLVTIGACATAGGIQALRNSADVAEYAAAVYARPDWIATLATSTPIAEHVAVDLEIRGCPISKHELLATITALLARRRPPVTSASCVRGMQAGGQPVCPGGRGHHLPRAGDPRRVWGAVPLVRPWVLRLLRAQRSGQRARTAGGLACGRP